MRFPELVYIKEARAVPSRLVALPKKVVRTSQKRWTAMAKMTAMPKPWTFSSDKGSCRALMMDEGMIT